MTCTCLAPKYGGYCSCGNHPTAPFTEAGKLHGIYCPDMLSDLRCQGLRGHTGPHAAYDPERRRTVTWPLSNAS